MAGMEPLMRAIEALETATNERNNDAHIAAWDSIMECYDALPAASQRDFVQLLIFKLTLTSGLTRDLKQRLGAQESA